MRCASDHDPLPTFSAENKSCFDHAHDSEPFCLPEHISWNCFLRHLLKLANDRGAAIHSVLLNGISDRHCKTRHRNYKEQIFHRIPLRQSLSQRMYPHAIRYATLHSWSHGCYSVRSAVIGLTREARLAGKKHARSAALASIKVAVISANGSLGLTSYRIFARTRPAASERRSPAPTARAVCSTPCRIMSANTSWRCAPKAIRMPISRVRHATA